VSSQLSSAPRRTLNVRQAETVERLFAAASDLLEEVGHEQMTIRMVASRAGVSAATAYTYFASKDHLFAELFWRLLDSSPKPSLKGRTPETRVREVATHLAELIIGAPALAAAVNKSLLGPDPEVQRLRADMDALWTSRFRAAIGDGASAELLEALTCAFAGALVRAGMGLTSFEDLPDIVGRVVVVIMRGSSSRRLLPGRERSG
jgi:AcrR family transcriptional regulator